MALQNGVSIHRTLDAETVLEDGIAARTASGVGTVETVARVIDFVGADSIGFSGEVPHTEFDFCAVAQAADDGDGNETYTLILQLSNSSDFSSVVAQETITVTRGTPDRWTKPSSNRSGTTRYRYARVIHTLGGTSPSLTYEAWLGVVPK